MQFSEIYKKGYGAPSPSDLIEGGFGIDVVNKKAYSKATDGTIFQIGLTDAEVTAITDLISTNAADIVINAADILTNSTDIATNVADIATNTAAIVVLDAHVLTALIDSDAVTAVTALNKLLTEADIGVANSSYVKTALNADGNAPVYAPRAWVNFDGTTITATYDTTGLRAGGNIAALVDNGIGQYTVYFTTAMEDINYVPIASAYHTHNVSVTCEILNTSSVKLKCGFEDGENTKVDVSHCYLMVLR